MKKLITLSLVSALVLSASSLAFATEIETSEKTKPVRTQNEQVMKQAPEKSASIEDKKAEMQILADEAGLTLEEYIETIKTAREERADKAEMTERADKAEMTERADKAEMTERADKAEMTERADKAEMTERADKAEMTERTVKADMTANFKGNSRR